MLTWETRAKRGSKLKLHRSCTPNLHNFKTIQCHSQIVNRNQIMCPYLNDCNYHHDRILGIVWMGFLWGVDVMGNLKTRTQVLGGWLYTPFYLPRDMCGFQIATVQIRKTIFYKWDHATAYTNYRDESPLKFLKSNFHLCRLWEANLI